MRVWMSLEEGGKWEQGKSLMNLICRRNKNWIDHKLYSKVKAC